MIPSDRFQRLAAAARNGCQQSLGELLEELRPYLLRIANDLLNSALRPKCAASDLVQETVMKATGGFGDFRGISDAELRCWLVAILKNQLVDVERAYLCSDKRRLAAEQSLDYDQTREAAACIAAPTSSPEIREEVQQLFDAIAQLPERTRNVVLWRHQEGLSFAEIGRRLGCSQETARRRWHEAVKKLTCHVSKSENAT